MVVIYPTAALDVILIVLQVLQAGCLSFFKFEAFLEAFLLLNNI